MVAVNHAQSFVPPRDRRSPILLLPFKTRARSSTRRKLPSRTNGLPRPRPLLRKPRCSPARRLSQKRLGHPFHCQPRQMAPTLQPISFRPRASRRATARCPLLLVIPSYPRLSAPILSNSWVCQGKWAWSQEAKHGCRRRKAGMWRRILLKPALRHPPKRRSAIRNRTAIRQRRRTMAQPPMRLTQAWQTRCPHPRPSRRQNRCSRRKTRLGPKLNSKLLNWWRWDR